MSRTETTKPWTPQFTASSVRSPFDRDGRPSLHSLELPGPRRETEGRGGAISNLTALRVVIRSPLLPGVAAVIPARTGGRPAAVPDLFWVFYLQAARYFASMEQLDRELRAHWQVVREEFWFEHGVLLPDGKANGDVPNSDDFRKWRQRNILNRPGVLDALAARLTDVSLPLTLAIRRSEDGDQPRPLHTPAIWDLLAVDGTVLDAPSDVREVKEVDGDGVVTTRVYGSRAKTPGNARVHHTVHENIGKKHGATKGLFNVVATTKGLGTYTRVVLGVDIGEPGVGEDPVAMRMLGRLYDQIGRVFPVLLYDGAMKPIYFQDLMAEYGVYCVNANYTRPKPRKDSQAAAEEPSVTAGPSGPRTPLGLGRRRYGVARGKAKRTYATPLESILHEADGYHHSHHLAADDGAVYELNRPVHAGGDIYKTQLLEPVNLELLQAPTGEFYLRLTLAGHCEHGGRFEVSYELRKTRLSRDDHLPWRSLVANIRVIPDALVERFGEVYGQRNQVESFFSWLEDRFCRKDRHASWGRDAQLFDLIGAALLHNSLTWAHLAYRDPAQADQMRAEIAALTHAGINTVTDVA